MGGVEPPSPGPKPDVLPLDTHPRAMPHEPSGLDVFEPGAGVEPAACRLQGGCSTSLSYPGTYSCGGGENRTGDHLLKGGALPTELLRHRLREREETVGFEPTGP